MRSGRTVLCVILLLLSACSIIRAQNISISPKLIAFPNQGINSSSSAYSVTLMNNQPGTLTITSIQASAPFSQTNDCPSTLAPNQQCTITVMFSPTVKQYYSSSLVITDSAANSPQTVSLTGNGVIPVSLSPAAINFPSQAVNTTSSASSFKVTNNLSSAVSISSIAAPSGFAETDDCGTALAGGSSCTVNLTFAPTAVQYYASSITITDSALTSPQTLPVTGNSVNAIAYSPRQISFPNQGIYSTSTGYAITLTNNQPSTPISISSLQIAAPFAQSNNCGSSLPGGQSCTINVTFTPTAAHYYSSTHTINLASGSPILIPVVGNGIVPVSFTPKVGGLYFVRQVVNTPSTPQPVTITNNQPTALTFTSIASSSAFPFTTNCGDGAGGGTLAPGATCTIQVAFNPPATSSYAANLTIAEDAYGSPITIPLQGAGMAGTPGNTVLVKPSVPCILPSGAEQFSANVSGLSSNAVDWFVDGIKGGNATVGTISASGLYNAPATSATHTIKAVSQVSSTVSGSATLTITTTTNYEIYPFVSSIPPGGQQQFEAQTCQVPDTNNVTFSVDNIAGGNSTVGMVSPTGLYTAPSTAGKHTVRVTDPVLNKTSGAVVTVFSSITADFGSHADNTPVVPANMFGYGRGESIHNATERALLTDAGVTDSRMSAQIATVFATPTPDWTMIDPMMADLQATGQHAILQLNQSPPWLQPTTGSCAGNVYAAPTDITQWAQIAAAYVAHLDSAFPGVVQDYEIWNEPNATGICTSADHLKTYLAIYAAAAPLMKSQAALDAQTVRVGGPVLSGYSQLWLSNLLTNPTTAPYVDFISYHQYFFGTNQLQAQWDSYTGDLSLYEMTQDPSNGAFAIYNKVLGQAALGSQPGGASTPIYITEFNTNWAFFKDCCRNDAAYAPVWNSLYAIDLLNSVYNGSAHMLNKLDYFAGNAYPYFCMIGVQDADSDCLYSTGADPVPYPQYYAFQLLASSSYLGLQGGGYMAKSISTPTGGGGLATTAFYTATQDAIVITNPTSASYPAINVTFSNPGISSTQGILYTIENGAEIDASNISFATQGTTRSATIPVPPYSVQAISLK
jgi:Glycosyl hydrolases family 39